MLRDLKRANCLIKKLNETDDAFKMIPIPEFDTVRVGEGDQSNARAADELRAVVEGTELISEVYSISGQYDLMMKCYLDDGADIGHFVTSSIQTLPGVKDTFTMITFKTFT